MNSDLEQQLAGLVTATEAAAMKKMSLQLFKHYRKKPGAPEPVHVGKSRHPYFWEIEITAWEPKVKQQQGGRP